MRPLVIAVPVALLLAACSGTAKTPDAALSGDPLPTVIATTPVPTPASTTSTPTASPTPTPGRKVPAVAGDVDGDGKPDAVRTTATVLTVELSGTATTVKAPIHADAPRSAPVLGSKDVDRDGFAEIFIETAQGASTSFATPYRFDGKALRELQLDGGPARLGIGGTVTHGDGFTCTPTGLLEVRSADSSDGQSFTVHSSIYRLGPTELILVSTSTRKAKQGDRAVEDSYNVNCGSVGEGG